MNYNTFDPATLDPVECERMAYASGDTWTAGVLRRLIDAEQNVSFVCGQFGDCNVDDFADIAELQSLMLDALATALPYVEDAAEFDQTLKPGVAAAHALRIRELIARAEAVGD